MLRSELSLRRGGLLNGAAREFPLLYSAVCCFRKLVMTCVSDLHLGSLGAGLGIASGATGTCMLCLFLS